MGTTIPPLVVLSPVGTETVVPVGSGTMVVKPERLLLVVVALGSKGPVAVLVGAVPMGLMGPVTVGMGMIGNVPVLMGIVPVPTAPTEVTIPVGPTGSVGPPPRLVVVLAYGAPLVVLDTGKPVPDAPGSVPMGPSDMVLVTPVGRSRL